MAILPASQQLVFNKFRTVSDGANIIVNGAFDTDLSSWIPDNFAWNNTHAEYQWLADCYRGTLTQEDVIFLKGRYKLRFKYRALSPFELYVSVLHKTNSAFDLLKQQQQEVVYDGLWHTIEIDLCSIPNSAIPTSVLNDVIFECRSIYASDYSQGDFDDDFGGDFYGACLDTGHEEEGFFLDDVSIYKQKEILPCNFLCSEVIMDANRNIEFQIIKETYNQVNILDLSKNPFSPVTATTIQLYCDFFTKPSFAVNIGDYFTLYMGQKVYVFVFGTTFAFPYVHTIDGDFNLIEIAIAPIVAPVALEYFLNIVFDINHATTSALIVPQYTLEIQNMPSDSFFSQNMAFDSIVGINTLIGIPVSNFVYEGGKLCYRKINGSILMDSTAYEKTARIYTTLDAVVDVKYVIELAYISDYGDFTNAYIDFYDGINHVSIPITIEYGSNTAIIEFVAPSTSTYTIYLNIEDASGHNKGFCVESFAYKTEEEIKVFVKDCNGLVTEVEYLEKKYQNRSLIQINYEDFPDNGMQVIVQGLMGDVGCEYISQPIKLVDIASLRECLLADLLKITWTDNCYFGDLDYVNLPFINEWYLQGFTRKINSNNRNRTQYVNTDGTISTVFIHSVKMEEIKVGVYDGIVHDVIENALMHGVFSINDVYYFVIDGTYTLNEAGKGFTARIDLGVKDNVLIKSLCC